MANLGTVIWTLPSALPKPAGVTTVPPTAVPATASRIKFSALKAGIAWPVALNLFQTDFDISFDAGTSWQHLCGHTDDGSALLEDGLPILESYLDVHLPAPVGPNVMIRGTITIGATIPASAFTLSVQ